MKDRQRIALIVGGVLVVVVVAAVALFGLLSPPTFRDLREAPALDAPGTVAYTTDEDGARSCVHVVPASGATAPRELACRRGWAQVAWSPDGTLAMWTGGGSVELLDPDTGEVVREAARPSEPEPWLSPEVSGVRTYDEDRRVRITVAVGDEVRTVLDEPAPDDYWIGWTGRSADGRWLLFSDSERRLVLLDVDGEVEPGVIATGVDWQISWSAQQGR